ncbi:MAG: anthranilate synthase, component I (EC 4.1.3.27) [Glomeribacter sp. 1016415]|nr:anthranilate synthase, component I (EC 4.1.3.27) [Glomeribacter sp. 1016415]
MTEIEFQSLAAQGYNRIPLIAEALADLETPLSLYLKLAHTERCGAYSFLLESVVGGERFGRYSFIGLPAHTLVRAFGERCEIVQDGVVRESHEGDPLAFIAAFQKRFKVAQRAGLPRFCGGLAGYFGYDAVRYIEKKLKHTAPSDELGLPDIQLLLTEELAVIDNLAGKLYLIVYANPAMPEAYTQAKQRLRELRTRLNTAVQLPVTSSSVRTEIYRQFKKEEYLQAVRTAKECIAAGELMQVQISQRLVKPYRDSPLSLYRALRSLNPSPYMYFYNFGAFQVVGASPEILVRREQQGNAHKVTIRPLAGTRPRGSTPEQDAQLAAELLNDPKEIAEHVMLIDLARNDLGRIAQTGSVRVTEQMTIEKYSHVQHIVSSVEGDLKPELDNFDILRASFPAGTLSGAPKVRALELIDELEPVKRGLYGGAVGYMSFSGEMDLAIAIRTGLIHNGNLYVQAAAGIVADSAPEAEWQETENKARAVLRAAEQVQDGLDLGF